MGKYRRDEALARFAATTGLEIADVSRQELASAFRGILERKIHGITFSPYVEGQGPGTQITAEQIRARLDIIRPCVNWIRTFSCTEGNELIPGIAIENGLRTMVGVWLDDDRETNALEMANAIELAQAGHVDILAVGNEVLLRGDLSEDDLIRYLQQARQDVPADVEVGYVDAYFKFVDHPRVTDACDVVLANCYPFWEYCPVEYALLYMKDMYRRAVKAANGKQVIISETGWPSAGTPEGQALPSDMNALKYFIDTCMWTDEEEIDLFYFSAFDETWKTDREGDVGAFWGLWDHTGRLKFS